MNTETQWLPRLSHCPISEEAEEEEVAGPEAAEALEDDKDVVKKLVMFRVDTAAYLSILMRPFFVVLLSLL